MIREGSMEGKREAKREEGKSKPGNSLVTTAELGKGIPLARNMIMVASVSKGLVIYEVHTQGCPIKFQRNKILN